MLEMRCCERRKKCTMPRSVLPTREWARCHETKRLASLDERNRYVRRLSSNKTLPRLARWSGPNLCSASRPPSHSAGARGYSSGAEEEEEEEGEGRAEDGEDVHASDVAIQPGLRIPDTFDVLTCRCEAPESTSELLYLTGIACGVWTLMTPPPRYAVSHHHAVLGAVRNSLDRIRRGEDVVHAADSPYYRRNALAFDRMRLRALRYGTVARPLPDRLKKSSVRDWADEPKTQA